MEDSFLEDLYDPAARTHRSIGSGVFYFTCVALTSV